MDVWFTSRDSILGVGYPRAKLAYGGPCQTLGPLWAGEQGAGRKEPVKGGWGSSHGVGSSSSCPLLFFPCLECSGSEVLHLSWGCRAALGPYAQGGAGEAFRVGLGWVCSCRTADRAGQRLHLLHCCPWQRLLSPSPCSLGPPPQSRSWPALASPSPLSFALSLLLSRWPLGGRWMSGVYILHGRARWGALLVGVGLLSACAVSLPVVSGPLGCPLPAPQLASSPPASLARSQPQPQAENGESSPITCHSPPPLLPSTLPTHPSSFCSLSPH